MFEGVGSRRRITSALTIDIDRHPKRPFIDGGDGLSLSLSRYLGGAVSFHSSDYVTSVFLI